VAVQKVSEILRVSAIAWPVIEAISGTVQPAAASRISAARRLLWHGSRPGRPARTSALRFRVSDRSAAPDAHRATGTAIRQPEGAPMSGRARERTGPTTARRRWGGAQVFCRSDVRLVGVARYSFMLSSRPGPRADGCAWRPSSVLIRGIIAEQTLFRPAFPRISDNLPEDARRWRLRRLVAPLTFRHRAIGRSGIMFFAAADAPTAVPGEDTAWRDALHARLEVALAPEGPIEANLVWRLAVAMWAAERGDRLEVALLARPHRPAELAAILRYQRVQRDAVDALLRRLDRLRAGRARAAPVATTRVAANDDAPRPLSRDARAAALAVPQGHDLL
jgi:hypothetical protein